MCLCWATCQWKTSILMLIFMLQMSPSNARYGKSSDHDYWANKQSEPYGDCKKRCERLLERSLARIGYTPKMINDEYSSLSIHNRLFQNGNVRHSLKNNNTYFNDICWKYFDYSDCVKQCEISVRKPNPRRKRRRQNMKRLFHVATKLLLKDCKVSAPKKLLDQFRCVHKFRTFLDVQCSSYAKEAFHLRITSLVTPTEAQRSKTRLMTTTQSNQNAKNASNEEICRFLHYHSMCLANSIYQYCPSTTIGRNGVNNSSDEESTSIFNRFTLRDYFLSYILPLPRQEALFSDILLDECQLYDFQKMAKDIYASTRMHNASGEIGKGFTRQSHLEELGSEKIADSTSTTPRRRSIADWRGYDSKSQATIQPDTISTTTVKHRLFSSEEDLADTPPNFHYSSAKYGNNEMYNYYHRSTTTATSGESSETSIPAQSEAKKIDGLTTLKQSNDAFRDKSRFSSAIPLSIRPIGITYPDEHPRSYWPDPTVSTDSRGTSSSGFLKTSVRLPVDEHLSSGYDPRGINGHHKAAVNQFTSISYADQDRPQKIAEQSDETYSTGVHGIAAMERWPNEFMVTASDSSLPHSIHNDDKHTRLNNSEDKMSDEESDDNNNYDDKNNNNTNDKTRNKDGDGKEDDSNDRWPAGLDDYSNVPTTRPKIPKPIHNTGNQEIDDNYINQKQRSSAINKNNENDEYYNPFYEKSTYWPTDTPTDSLDNNLLSGRNPASTPMFMESRVQVKKIRPYDDGADVDPQNSGPATSEDYDYTGEKEFNWDDYYAENKIGNGIEDTYKDGSYSYDTATNDEDISYPYTITSVQPDEFVVYETKIWPASDLSDATRVSSGAPTSIEYVPEQKLDTWLVLLGIYSAFIFVSLCSLLCIGCAYLVRRYQIYREGDGALKWSWISFDLQEQL